MKKVITLILLIVFNTDCTMNNPVKTVTKNKSDVTVAKESLVTDQKKEILVKDTDSSIQIPIQKYSVEDVKRAFEGQNNGFKYFSDGFNKDTKRYMVSTDAVGHATSYHYEINMTTGDIYNDRNQVIDSLDDMLKAGNDKSITTSPSLESWVGDYSFSEFVPPNQNMFYRISMIREDGSYYAIINIDGFQTIQRLRAKVEGDKNSIKFIFDKYLPDNRFESYKVGDTLLSFEKKNSDLNTFWGKIEPTDKNNNQSGKVYFKLFNSLIPNGWHLVESHGNSKVEGDLNEDGIPDLALVIEENKMGESAQQRLLLIAIGNKDKSYSIAVTADKAVLRANEGGMMGEPFMGLSIDRGSLLISHYGGSAWRWSNIYRFRYQNDGWYLIGATEDLFHAVSSAGRKYEDINLLTGDYIKIETDDNGKEKKTEGNRGKKKLVNLLDFKINVERQF